MKPSAAQRRSTAESRSRLGQVVILLFCVLLAWLVSSGPVGHVVDNNIADVLVRWIRIDQKRPGAASSSSTLIAIDEQTLSRHGGMRALRSIVSAILERLSTTAPAVVAVDLTLADAGEPAEDARLSKALAALPAVVLAAEIRSAGEDWELPVAAFAKTVQAIGHVHAAPDPMDSVCRAIPLEKAVARQRYWALSLEAYRLWRGENYVLETPDALLVGSTEIPAHRDDGRLLRIRFLPPRGSDTSGVLRFSAAELIAPSSAVDLPTRGVYFVGITAPSAARDRLMTPFSYGRTMQGVEIHANAFETLAGRRFYQVPPALVALLLSLAMAATVGLAFLYFANWRTYALAAAPLVLSMAAPPLAYSRDILLPSTLVLLSAWLPFFALAAHRYWFVNRKLHKAERETENYRDAIHYVTHEMRTPLTAIQGSSELISRYSLSADKQKQIAGMIHSESKRLGRIIQVFLDVERLSAGQMQLRAELVDPEALVSLCVERAAPLATGKEIALEVRPFAEQGLALRGDRELLEHALYNLVTNAIKYSPGGTTVRLHGQRRGDRLVLSVADEGMGMTPEEQRAVFRKFYRTEGAERSGEKGSGIGLSIVEQIVTAHQGQIELQSEPGKGSVFSLVLPVH